MAESVAIKDSLIYRVGSNQDIQPLIGTETGVRNLNGKCMTPGMIDAHTHFMYCAQGELDNVNFQPPAVQTVEDVVAKIEEHTQMLRFGKWVIGDGFF